MNIDVMTLAQEDIDAIIKSREECARKAKIHDLIDTLKKTLDELHDTGVAVHLYPYGGHYESFTTLYVNSENIQFKYK